MKKIIQYSFVIIELACISFIACKKEKIIPGSVTPLEKAKINFHIQNNSTVAGNDVYLYRIISYPTYNIYDSTQNIYLRPNIDTTFIFTVEGNTTNLFIIGKPDPDEIPYYMESKFLVAGSNINWHIEY